MTKRQKRKRCFDLMRKSLLYGVFFGIVILYGRTPSVYAEEVYLYESHGKRDPFVPLVGVTSRVVSTIEDIMSIEDVKIQGVATDSSGRKIAIINGEMVREGEARGRLTVKAVEGENVLLLIDEEEHKINLYEKISND